MWRLWGLFYLIPEEIAIVILTIISILWQITIACLIIGIIIELIKSLIKK